MWTVIHQLELKVPDYKKIADLTIKSVMILVSTIIVLVQIINW